MRKLTKQEIRDLDALKHIENLLSTVVTNVTKNKFDTAKEQDIDTIRINAKRAWQAVRNALRGYH